MAYRRKGRDTWLTDVRTETGWRQLSLRTPAKALAGRMETMWETLATEHRAWDVLNRVLDGSLTIGRLYDLWTETKYDLAEIRRRLRDVDLSPIVEEFLEVHRRSVKAESAGHAEVHVRWLVPGGQSFLASRATIELLTQQLYRYKGKRNTLRKVHSSWSMFFAYCTEVRGLYAANPMLRVARPTLEKPPIQFYELEVVDRIIAWQPTLARRALYALLYGTGIELSTALGITRADVWQQSREIRAAGTKAHTRDRVARVDEWAWPILWEYAKGTLPATPLWHGLTRWTASDWHRQTVKDGVKNTHGVVVRESLGLKPALRLHAARHSWAVRNLRAGVPVAVVQQQLGHATAKETLDTYGPFVPTGADRERWALHVAGEEAKRREAR